MLFILKIKIEQLLDDQSTSSQPTHQPCIRLPKISIPTFNGNLLNWTSFWKQFEVTVHSKDNLQDVEKLAYLKDVVKDTPARRVVEGLLRMAGNYAEGNWM